MHHRLVSVICNETCILFVDSLADFCTRLRIQAPWPPPPRRSQPYTPRSSHILLPRHPWRRCPGGEGPAAATLVSRPSISTRTRYAKNPLNRRSGVFLHVMRSIIFVWRPQIVAISVGVVSVAIGIGIPVFYETQIDNAVSHSVFPLIQSVSNCVPFTARIWISFFQNFRWLNFTVRYLELKQVDWNWKVFTIFFPSWMQAKRDNTQPCFPCSGSGARMWHCPFFRLMRYFFSSVTAYIVDQNIEHKSLIFLSEVCRFCTGKGTVTVVIGGGETEVSNCVNCDGVGSLTCTTCQGSGIQPRYLDRRCVLWRVSSILIQ